MRSPASKTGSKVNLHVDPVEEVLDRLRESGGRITTSRRILLRCLFEKGPHRTAEELAAESRMLRQTCTSRRSTVISTNLNASA
jgi:Fe2+ or Zn2+ uptake regulation protein